MTTRILASVLGGQRGSVWASLLTKGETARWLRAPTHPSADLTRRQKRPLTSSERSDPNANSPNDPACGRGAHPTRIPWRTSSIGGAVPSSTGVAFAGGAVRLVPKRLIPPDGVKQRVELLLDQDHAAVDGLQKRFLDHVVKEVQQAIVKSLRVKERAGLGVAAELPPGPGPRRSLPKCRCRRAQRALRFQMVEVAVP